MMASHKKPKPPAPVVPGAPAGKVGPLERKTTIEALGYSALGMLVMGVKLISQFANTGNVSDMLTTGGYTGGVGLIVIGITVILKAKYSNNTAKRL